MSEHEEAMRKRGEEFLKANLIGPTGRFPQGRLNETDEGELRVAIGVEGNQLVMHFGKAVTWLSLPKGDALALADLIRMKAETM